MGMREAMQMALDNYIKEQVGDVVIAVIWSYTPETSSRTSIVHEKESDDALVDRIVREAVSRLTGPVHTDVDIDFDNPQFNFFGFSYDSKKLLAKLTCKLSACEEEGVSEHRAALDAARDILVQWSNMRYNNHSMLVWTD